MCGSAAAHARNGIVPSDRRATRAALFASSHGLTHILDDGRKIQEFSLLGGPLHRLACRIGLVRERSHTFPLGLALGALLWGVLAVLSWVEGIVDYVFSLSVIGAHVRLLVAIPLFFLAESLIAPRVTGLINQLMRSELVPESSRGALTDELARATRRAESWIPDAACLIAAMAFILVAPQLDLPGVSAAYGPARSEGAIVLTGLWFWMVCMTAFRFLLLRWLWRLLSWTYFLWRLSRLELRLHPTHPDGAAGLGCLDVVQAQFSPLILAFSAIQCAIFAEAISVGSMMFEEIYSGMALLIIAVAVLFLGPACVFSGKLWACRVQGLGDYMALAAHYVSDFHEKWIISGKSRREELLGTGDLQSLADLNTAVGIVRDMRLFPISTRTLTEFGLAVLVPALPLLLFKYPLAELAQELIARISGL